MIGTIVPGFENYSFTRDGDLHRIARGRGATLGVKSTAERRRQTTYRLNKNGKGYAFSRATMLEMVFGEPGQRWPQGQECHTAKLTADQVIKIRHLHAAGWTLPQLAAEFGVCKSTVHYIVQRKTWRYVE